MLTERRRLTAFYLLLIGLTALAYWPGLSGGFIFDDYPNILQQERIHAESLDPVTLQRAALAFNQGPVGRPLATLSFAFDHVIGGKEPWGYKLSGLLVHLANTCLVFLLARRLLRLSRSTQELEVSVALLLALTWAIHPLQVSTVLYVVQRMETLSATFVLLGLLAYLKGRQLQTLGSRSWPWLATAPVMMGVGLLSKETALLLPAYTLALELTLLKFCAAQPNQARWLRLAYATIIAISALAFILIVVPHYADPAVYAIRDYSAVERLMTQLRVLPMYLGWTLFPQPSNFSFYYDNYPVSRGLFEPTSTLVGGLFIASLITAAILSRKRFPLFSLGIIWFFASHSITSNIFPLELVFEHRNYFSIFAVLLAITEIAARLPLVISARARKLILTVFIGGLALLTTIRSAAWGDPLHLAMTLVADNPGSARASTDLGEQYMVLARNDAGSRFYTMGIREFERGSQLPNSSPLPEQGLVAFAAAAGQEAEPEWWDSMIHKLQTRTIGPQEFSMITGLLRLRDEEGLAIDNNRLAEAYVVLANRTVMPATQYFAFGNHALVHAKEPELALQLFQLAVDRSEGSPELAEQMVGYLLEKGEPGMAVELATYAQLPDSSNSMPPSNQDSARRNP